MANINTNQSINPHALYWLFGTLVFVCLPHLDHLPAWCIAFIAIVMGIKAHAILKRRIKISRWLVLLMTVFAVTGVLMEYSQLLGRNAGITLLVAMLFLKFLETHAYRDGMLLNCIMCFLVITNFLFEQEILMGVYMFIGVIAITHIFILLNELTTPQTVSFALPKQAASITLYSLPIMVIFFFIFPRIPGPLWGLPADATTARSGLSDKMEFGNIGQLALSNEPAFRVEFNGEIPPRDALYWRGIVMEAFDGDTWSEDKTNVPADPYQVSGSSYTYTITLEPHNKRWLFMLEMPEDLSGVADSQFNSRYQLAATEDIKTIQQYSVTSRTRYVINATLSTESRALNLYLPNNINPRTRALAEQWRLQANTPEDVINSALDYFRNQAFFYSLRPPLLSGDKIDEFLFNTRKGFCEHYAGSFVFLMRAAGIPARIVTGYQGGEINALSDYMIIKQADAHAWAEVWLENRGWVRVDPTAAIAPNRIENNIDAALSQQENPRFLLTQNNIVLKNMRFLFDSVNHGWNQWIIAYDRQKQNQLFSKLGFQYNASHAVIGLTAFMLVVFVILYYWMLIRKQIKRPQQPHQKLYQKFLRLLEKQGIEKAAYENAHAFHQRAIGAMPWLATEIKSVTKIYNEMEYGNRQNETALANFKVLLQRIAKSKQPAA